VTNRMLGNGGHGHYIGRHQDRGGLATDAQLADEIIAMGPRGELSVHRKKGMPAPQAGHPLLVESRRGLKKGVGGSGK